MLIRVIPLLLPEPFEDAESQDVRGGAWFKRYKTLEKRHESGLSDGQPVGRSVKSLAQLESGFSYSSEKLGRPSELTTRKLRTTSNYLYLSSKMPENGLKSAIKE